MRTTAEALAPVLALLLFMPRPAGADTDARARRAAAPRGSAPTPALLEFLGSFETAGGRWIDPMALAPGRPPAPARNGADAGGGGEARKPQRHGGQRR